MAITVEKSLLNNQSILQDFGLVEELDAQSAEIIAGGCCYPCDGERDRYPRDREQGCYPRNREYTYSIG